VILPGLRGEDIRRATLPKTSGVGAALPRNLEESSPMAYVITEPCIGTKDNSCVEVCPVDCIHPTPDEPGYGEVEQLFIDPDECIDCDACVEACPVDACFAEDQLSDKWAYFAGKNAAFFKS
jgi:NAD-dependent dihydropyrimidine dehydrogenase PreA subunit